MTSFWKTLSRPLYVLAPMADVTDPAYRRLISETRPPAVMWTEFVSADGLYYTREKKGIPDKENPLMRDLQFTPGEHPIVAQLFGSNRESMEYAAKLCASLGFDGIDLNMGCPDRSIEKQGCGAAMIRSPGKAIEMLSAARSAGIPVSIKTRIGYNHEEIDTWIRSLLAAAPVALTVHLRTRKEMSKVPAHWEYMQRIVALRDHVSPETVVLGNGDVVNLEEARRKIEETGCDGVMIGRGIFGNPWVFDPDTRLEDRTTGEKVAALRTLAVYFGELRPAKSFHILKKHVKAFITGFSGAPELRSALMEAPDLAAFLCVLDAAVY